MDIVVAVSGFKECLVFTCSDLEGTVVLRIRNLEHFFRVVRIYFVDV